jgi:hypothetical protein
LYQSSITDYTNTFVQREPRFALKKGEKWLTIHHGLWNKLVRGHLDGEVNIACLGRWYPSHTLFDFDDVEIERIQEIRDNLSMDDNNSFLCTSESPRSYHLLFRPLYRGKPPTLDLLSKIVNPFARRQGFEAYPTDKKVCRLPFGPMQYMLNHGCEWITDWRDKLYWFQKLDEYDLFGVPHDIQVPDLEYPKSKGKISSYTEGQHFLQCGLQFPSTRYEGQFKILYYLWRQNVPLDTAIETTWKWINDKNNGSSKDIFRHPLRVKKEIKRQAAHIYSTYILPDSTHNTLMGFITKEDLPEILQYGNGSMVKSRFLYQIVKYCYPRRLRTSISIKSARLIEWASHHTYLKRIRELELAGIVKREKKYIVNFKSKELCLNWRYKDPSNAILVDARSPDTLEETIAAAYTVEEVRGLLKKSGTDRRNINTYVRTIYSPERYSSVLLFEDEVL